MNYIVIPIFGLCGRAGGDCIVSLSGKTGGTI